MTGGTQNASNGMKWLTPRQAALASILLLMAVRCWWPSATWAACIAAGTAMLIWLCRWASDDPWLTRIALASYGLRVVLTLILFVISYLGLPIFEGIQRGQGFWQIGGDGVGYHEQALKILDAWRLGIDLPSTFRDGLAEHSLYRDLALPVALLYKVLRPFALHALLFNAWLGAITVIPGYLMVHKLADRRGARRAAVLLGFWPSFLIWSTQLLKDPFTALAIATLFYCLTVIWWAPQPRAAGVRRWVVTLAPWGGLFISVATLTYFRRYMGYIFIASLGIVMGIACVRYLFRRQWRTCVRSTLLITTTVMAVLLTHSVDVLKLLSPRHAEVAHVVLGLNYLRLGDPERAMLSYMRALELKPQFAPAEYHLKSILSELVDAKGELHETNGELFDQEARIVQVRGGAKVDLRVITKATRVIATSVLEQQPAVTIAAPAERKNVVQAGGGGEVNQPVGAVKASQGIANRLPEPRPTSSVTAQVKPLMGFASLQALNSLRRGMITSGGHFNVDGHVALDSVWDVLAYLPRALALAFFSPFPTQWFDTQGETGVFRPLSSIEVILIGLLMPGMLYACWSLLRRYGEVGQVVVVFSLVAAILLSLVVTNLGILFRLRLQYLLPMLMAIGVIGLPQVYRVVFRRAMGLVLRRKEHALS